MRPLAGRRFGAMFLAAGFLGSVPISGAAATPANDAVARYARVLGEANGGLSGSARQHLAERLIILSAYYDLETALLAAIVTTESSWHAGAVSPVGALGYGQLMPGTAASLRVEALDGTENLDGTARYLRRMMLRYARHAPEQQMRLAIASYNAGPGAVDRYGGVPPYRETVAYVANVLRLRRLYAAATASRPSEVAGAILAARPAPATPRVLRVVHHRVVRPAHAHRVLAANWVPRDSPYLHALDPNAYETPAPRVRHGLAGLVHRIFHPDPAAAEPVSPSVPGSALAP